MSAAGAEERPRREQVTQAAQRAAGVIAARDQGDLRGAEELLSSFSTETERTFGFYVVAELSLKMLAATTGESLADCASGLSLDIDDAL